MTITADQLQAILPHITPANLAKFLPHLQQFMPHWHIDTPQRVGGFIAQCGEECLNFSDVIEGDDGTHFAHYEPGTRVGKQLGNTEPGDGAKFRGRGPIQTTGKGNYAWCSMDLFGDHRLLDHPELLELPENGVNSACWFWEIVKPLNKVCDHPEDWTTVWHVDGKTYTKIQWMTLLVNGGENGIDVRTANYERARHILNF